MIDIEAMIKEFAKHKRIPQEDFPEFREKILEGLRKFGLDKNSKIEDFVNIKRIYG